MKRLSVSIIAVLAFALLSSGLLLAQPAKTDSKAPRPGMERMHKMGMFRAEMIKKLNLTDQQKQKIADLKVTFEKNMVDLRADLQKNKLDLKGLKVKGDLNRSDVIAAVEKINKSKNAISLAVTNHMLDVYEVLTPEQQKIWKESRFDMMGGMQHGKKMWKNKGMMK